MGDLTPTSPFVYAPVERDKQIVVIMLIFLNVYALVYA
jgi:hypothetical protein